MTIEYPEFISYGKTHRFNRDEAKWAVGAEVVITEKVDGTNALVYVDKNKGLVLAGSKEKWLVEGVNDNFDFLQYVNKNKEYLMYSLKDGYNYGEYWGPGVGRSYNQEERFFSPFDGSGAIPVLYRGKLSLEVLDSLVEDLTLNGSKLVLGYMHPEGLVIQYMEKGYGTNGHMSANVDRIRPNAEKVIIDKKSGKGKSRWAR